MRNPTSATKSFFALAVAVALVVCIAPVPHAYGMSVAVTSDSGNHVVVDVDLNGGAPDGDAGGKGVEKGGRGNSASAAEVDNTMKAFEALMSANDTIIIFLFFLFFFFFLPIFLVSAMILIFYVLMK